MWKNNAPGVFSYIPFCDHHCLNICGYRDSQFKENTGMIRESNINHHNIRNVKMMLDDEVCSAESVRSHDAKQFFSTTVHWVANINTKTTNTGYTIKSVQILIRRQKSLSDILVACR